MPHLWIAMKEDCSICNRKADIDFNRVEVWSSSLWRLTISRYSSVRGFCYLEPIRHIEHITDLDGREAETFGRALADAASSIKESTGSELVYVYIYGDHIPHLHVHLAPHRTNDIYADDVVKAGIVLDGKDLEQGELNNLVSSIREMMASS